MVSPVLETCSQMSLRVSMGRRRRAESIELLVQRSNVSCVGFNSLVCEKPFLGLGWTTGLEPAPCCPLHSKASCATEVLCWQGEIGKRIPERYIRIFRSNQTRYAKPAKHTMVYATPSLCTLSRSSTSHVPIHNIITNSRLARRQLH
jgi:hypothetical protein